MSQTLLATTLTAVARTIGDHLPAAFEMQPGEVQVGGDASDHPQPQAARTCLALGGPKTFHHLGVERVIRIRVPVALADDLFVEQAAVGEFDVG